MEYIVHILILSSIYAILALGLNLVIGYTGLLSITHAAFFGIGAYTTAILSVDYHMNFFLTILVGIILNIIIALVIGFILQKFNEDYFALGSFGFNIIVWSIFLNWDSLTQGPLGIPGILRPSIGSFSFTDNTSFLILSLVLLLLTFLISQFIVNSSFGRVLKAIREDEKAIEVFGYNILSYKLAIFAIGAGLASIAGSLFAVYITFIDPSSFALNESIFILSTVILGGLANLKGSLVGTFFLIILPEVLRFVGFPSSIAAEMRLLTYGLLLILLMLYRPQGFMGEYKL
ncbi:MAG: branched-chain amino acid ABC transporter permease [Candidatus Pacebacteria bacterium]|nr:branched-chain amino acid ABC transporter permease [Candidatus Paceibacterota bacterium]